MNAHDISLARHDALERRAKMAPAAADWAVIEAELDDIERGDALQQAIAFLETRHWHDLIADAEDEYDAGPDPTVLAEMREHAEVVRRHDAACARWHEMSAREKLAEGDIAAAEAQAIQAQGHLRLANRSVDDVIEYYAIDAYA